MATLELDKLTKVYDNGTFAVRDLELDIGDGEFMVLVGPSGCGKTTALRMVAGLERITSGTLRIDGQVMNNVAPKDRDIAMVFQDYALYPQMTVAQNMGFALRRRGVDRATTRAKVLDVGRTLGIDDLLDRKPSQLSGGQRQRVAMGRALVREPAVFLMDEPLSNLDAKLRVRTRAEVMALQRQLGVATVYVTHDQVEAMTMGQRVAVIRHGTLQQCDTPQTLYEHPANLFVAGFIGSPPMNLLRAWLSDDGSRIRIGEQHLLLADHLAMSRSALAPYRSRELVVGIRPEDLSDPQAAASFGEGRVLIGDIAVIEALGNEQLVHISIVGGEAVGSSPEDATVLRGGISAVARLGARPLLTAGERIQLGVNTDQLQFFDADSGCAI